MLFRGHAALEALIGQGISEAFESPPAELQRLNFPTRLALFAALVRLPTRYVPMVSTLTRLRNDFAHGRIKDLTAARARTLAEAFEEAMPLARGRSFPSEMSPNQILAQAVRLGYITLETGIELARERREEQQESVKFRRDVEKMLTESRTTE